MHEESTHDDGRDSVAGHAERQRGDQGRRIVRVVAALGRSDALIATLTKRLRIFVCPPCLIVAEESGHCPTDTGKNTNDDANTR